MTGLMVAYRSGKIDLDFEVSGLSNWVRKQYEIRMTPPLSKDPR